MHSTKRARSRSPLKREEQNEEISSTSHMDTNTNSVAPMAGGTNHGIGFRGMYKGNLQHQGAFARRYKEILPIQSRKVYNFDLYWAFGRAQNNTQVQYWTQQPVGQAFDGPGLDWNIWYPRSDNANQYWNYDWASIPISDMIRAQPVNAIIRRFLDRKTVDLMRPYTKFKLLKFAVTMQPRTYRINMDAMAKTTWSALPSSTNTITPNLVGEEVSQDYWVVRDQYNDFANPEDAAGNISIQNARNNFPVIPPMPGPGIPKAAGEWASPYSMRNLDDYLGIMSEKEIFHYERDIESRGSYYITRDAINQWYAANNFTNMGQLVADLEGVNIASGTIQNLPEGFNFLIVPCNAPCTAKTYQKTDPPNWSITPDIMTKLYVKFTAHWEAFDWADQSNSRDNFSTTTHLELETSNQNYHQMLTKIRATKQ